MLEGEFATFLVARIKAESTKVQNADLHLYVNELERVIGVVFDGGAKGAKRTSSARPSHRPSGGSQSTTGTPSSSTVGTPGASPGTMTRNAGGQ